MLDPAGARPPVPNTPNDRRNPLVELPEPAEVRRAPASTPCSSPTCTRDHLDETAVDLLPKDVPLFCQPPDEGVLRDRGFTDVRPVEDDAELGGVTIARTGGRHGTGEIAEMLAPVLGLRAARARASRRSTSPATRSGATRWPRALDAHDPDVVVVNAGGARFTRGRPDHDDRRRRRRGRRATRPARGSSPCTWRRSTTASRRARTCTSACTTRASQGRVTVPEDGALVPCSRATRSDEPQDGPERALAQPVRRVAGLVAARVVDHAELDRARSPASSNSRWSELPVPVSRCQSSRAPAGAAARSSSRSTPRARRGRPASAAAAGRSCRPRRARARSAAAAAARSGASASAPRWSGEPV